jgi:hypothetical protein
MERPVEADVEAVNQAICVPVAKAESKPAQTDAQSTAETEKAADDTTPPSQA